MNTTDNYGLKKPEYSDYADIEILNDNMDIIDESLHGAETEASMDADTKTLLAGLGWTEAEARKIGSVLKYFGQKLGANPSTLKTSEKTIIKAINEICSNVIADGAGAHNAIYRGKSLGSSVTADQWTAISSGKFTDLFIGDYWTINGVTYRIAAFDYWYNYGDSACNKHHIVVITDANMLAGDESSTHWMNKTDTTAGAYVGSDFYTGNNGNNGKATILNAINSAFGSAHILEHKEYLKNAVTNGYESGGAWYASKVEIPTEEMVYGTKEFKNILNGSNIPANYTIGHGQLALFRLDHSRICNRSYWWLRDVVSSSNFAHVNFSGFCSYSYASNTWIGVRPVFGICA